MVPSNSSEFMLVIAGTWGMGYCEVLKMNIRIGLFADKFPRRGKEILWMLTFFVSRVVAGLVAWQAFVKTGDLFTATLGNRTDTLGIPVWPFHGHDGHRLSLGGFYIFCSNFINKLLE